MAERLIVENFGPIKKIDIELNRILILIGPQSVGKSTIAKLVAIFRDLYFIFTEKKFESVLTNYGMYSFLKKTSVINYESSLYRFEYKNGKGKGIFDENHDDYSLINDLEDTDRQNLLYLSFKQRKKIDKLYKKISNLLEEHSQYDERSSQIEQLKSQTGNNNEKTKLIREDIEMLGLKIDNMEKFVGKYFKLTNENDKFSRIVNVLTSISQSQYIPSERTLISIISDSIMNFLHYDIPVPKILTNFAAKFESAKSNKKEYYLDFLDITFKFTENENRLYTSKKKYFKLSNASSGLQSIIPLLVVLNHISSDDYASNTYVVEEPELNLYPINQYELSKILADLCFKKYMITERHNELIITTHSPYILAAFNNFLLAHKIGAENKEETSKVIPQQSWVDPEHFSAYYIDEKGIVSIFNKETGLIAENHLDQTSEIIMDDFNDLMDLYTTKARG